MSSSSPSSPSGPPQPRNSAALSGTSAEDSLIDAFTAGGLASEEEERRDALVVRLFPGWAQSPVWIPGGPVDPGESLLTRELVEDLLIWENNYYATSPQDPVDTGGAGEAGADPTPQERHYLADGIALAERLAAELGNAFAVSFESGRKDHFLARSAESATNPAAARVFDRWFAEEKALDERLRNSGPWYAYAPLSGDHFGSVPPVLNGPGN